MMRTLAVIDRCRSLPNEKEVTELVEPEDRKTREYNMIDDSDDYTAMPEETDRSIPFLDVNDKRPKRQTVPGLDTDKVSYSPSRTDRRGAGGRATMKTYGAQFMRSMDRKYMEGTKDSVWRRYKRMDKDIDYLFRLGKLSTTSPAKFTPEDVHNFISYRMSLNVSDAEMVHELAALSNIFAFIGNDAYKTAIVKYPYLKVSATHKKLPSLHEEECAAIIEAANQVKDDDWSSMVRYATVIFAFCSGLRSKELRFCNVNDVHIKDDVWTVDVLHPKGEGKYGEIREAPIHPDAYPFLTRYFVARAEHVRAIEATTRALFLGNVATDGYLATNTVRLYADWVSKETSIDVDLRKCRRTYGQRLVDAKVPISVVSVVMGHSSTRVTEQHYARVKQAVAVEEITKTFNSLEEHQPEHSDVQMPTGFKIRSDAPFETPKKLRIS